MNNPLRSLVQRRYEATKMALMGGTLEGGYALEIGCGRGVGTEIILNTFGAKQVDAFDLDPGMVTLAKNRLQKYENKVNIWEGNVCAIDAPENTYDGVFDFGIIHHTPNWRMGVKECYRVLKPGGRFYCEEVYRPFILHPITKRLLDHPLEDRFDHVQWGQYLEEVGFTLLASDALGSWFGWYVATK